MHRIQFQFPAPIFNKLKSIAEYKGESLSQVAREAIEFFYWVYEQRKDGWLLHLEKEGSKKELVGPFVP